MTSATALVIARNQDEFQPDVRRLVIEPTASDHAEMMRASTVLTFNYRSYQYFLAQGYTNVHFGLDDLLNGNACAAYDEIIVFTPKSKGELSLYLDLAECCLDEDGRAYLVGAKKEGIASAAKLLAARFTLTHKLDSAKHCQLWSGESKVATTNAQAFTLESYFGEFEIQLKSEALKIATLPGVFASGKLDEGTRFLLDQDIRRLKGRTLDFGCGAGVISAAIKKLNPEISVEAIDINWFSLKATQKTLAHNGLDAEVYPSDGWSEVKGRVNGIVTNPPFHQGVSTEYATTESFLKEAFNKMAKYAPMYVVANSFLKYEPVIMKTFGKCTRYAESNKFNVYYCER